MEEKKSVGTEFEDRLKVHYDELKWIYGELFHDSHAFDYFVSMLKKFCDERSPILKAWDKKRSEDAGWYKRKNMLGMLMYTNCFAKNIKGVKNHLPYIEECGVNYLHLMPLLESPEGRSDGGYAVSDFCKVDPKLGTMKDLADLSAACHKKGISLCLDFVMNHTSEDHEWAIKAKQGIKEYQDRYFFFDDWTIPNDFEKTVPQVFPTTAPGNFTYNPETGKVVMTTFYPYQWDLNYRNPTVFNDMTANMLFLVNNGVDIIRLDAVPYIWKTLGTNCRNLPEVHKLVRMMHIASEIVAPGTLLLGEVVMEPSKVVPYFGSVEKPECQMLYNVTTMASTWNTVATRNVGLLKHQMETVCHLPKEYTFLNYLRCHDDIGWGLDYEFLAKDGIQEVPHKKYLNDYLRGRVWGSDARGELYNDDPRLGDARLCGTTASLCGVEAAVYEKNDWKIQASIDLDITLHAFLFTQSGIPVLYSGDEIAQLNDYGYHGDPLKSDDSRYLHRGDFDWKLAEMRNDPETVQGMMFTRLKHLIDLRREYDVFDGNADVWMVETWNEHILGIGRYYMGQKLIGLFNFSEIEQTAWIHEEEYYTNLVDGSMLNSDHVTLGGHQFVWMFHDYEPRREPVKKAEVPKKKKAAAKKE